MRSGFNRSKRILIFEHGHPVYSSKMVRIWMGHSKLPPRLGEDENQADENYLWTYTSPEFPMLQEDVLQSFKLPRPVLCNGGVVKIELLGRTVKSIDDKYYICVFHAQVIGPSLSPVFKVDISDPAGHSILMYLSGARNLLPEVVIGRVASLQSV